MLDVGQGSKYGSGFYIVLNLGGYFEKVLVFSKSVEPISAQRCNLYKNQSFGLQCKSNDWFLFKMQLKWVKAARKKLKHH